MTTKKLSSLTIVVTALLMVLSVVATPRANMLAATAAATTPPTPTIVPTVMSSGAGCGASATKVTWYVGLGSGTDADVIPKEQAWADNYNKAHADTCVLLQVVHNPESYDTLHAEIAAGTGPDIVGPVGKLGREQFRGAWADISPLAKAANFDISKYDPTLLDFLKDDGVQIGLPFALFPGLIYYNKALFDEAKLPYPPHKVGDKYQGKDWTIDTMSQLAQKLTVDANGADATDPKFDTKNIKQFGMWTGFAGFRRSSVMFGATLPYDSKFNAKLPDYYRAFAQWYYDAMWKNSFIPTSDYVSSDLLSKGNPFSSGNTAMTWSFTWYTCCFDMKKLNWDIAVVPSYNGKITAGLNGDTFAITKGSKNQATAFKVLSAMVVDKDLSAIYGGIPGNTADRAAFFANMNDRTAPNKIDWNVALDMLKYPDIPNHESFMPNLTKSEALLDTFKTKMEQTAGLDIPKELDKLQSDLDALYKAAPPAAATAAK